MKNYLIIYHREDNDGVFSAAIAETYLRLNDKHIGVRMMPSDYGSMSKVTKSEVDSWAEEYDAVIITDISFNEDMMKYLYNKIGNKLIWIDHHKPIIKASFSGGFSGAPGERDTNRSAILLAFKFFFDPIDEYYVQNSVPKLFKMLSEWDSFTFSKDDFENVRNLNRGVTEHFKLDYDSVYDYVFNYIKYWNNHNKDIELDIIYNDYNMNTFMSSGKKLNEYDDDTIKKTIDEYGDMSWKVNGKPACALFIQQGTSSIMFKSVADKVDHGIVFKHRPDGNWVVSLYNTNIEETFHCGDYLKEKYGGGGHQGAAGCTLTQEQFISVLTKKEL